MVMGNTPGQMGVFITETSKKGKGKGMDSISMQRTRAQQREYGNKG